MQIYADNAATTKVSEAALEAMMPFFTEWYGNPSSVHSPGQRAEKAVLEARQAIAAVLGAKAETLYFTAGGTEADNWAIRTAAKLGEKSGKRHIVSTAFEHHAVLHTLRALEREGYTVTLLDVHTDGLVRPEELEAAIRDDTCLVTVMYANNEIGTVQPIREIGDICRRRDVLFHTDAVQAVGHIPVDVEADHIDLLSLSGHKFGGPKGVGALYCRRGIPLSILLEGGAQERGRRGGTENVPGIVGMAAALTEAQRTMEADMAYVAQLRDTLAAGLSQIPRTHYNGHRESRLPGIVNLCFEGIEGESLLLLLDMAGVAASSGSACTSGSLDPSHVLMALGLPHEIAHGSLRLSLDRDNTPAEVDFILQALPPIVERLRSMSPLWERISKGELEWLTVSRC